MGGQNVVCDKSFGFAVRIVKLYQYLCETKKEFVLAKQLLRSGTSIGANVAEAQRGVSRRDFGNKMAIALKESNETSYWLKLLNATGYINDVEFDSMHADCEELNRILTAIVKRSLTLG